MAGLLGAAKTRLNKAGDTDRDPADLTPPKSPERPKADTSASTTADPPDSIQASVSASENAGLIESTKDNITDGQKVSASASDVSSTSVTTPAPRKRTKTGKKPPRRVGRPAGPERVMVSVRLLVPTNDAITTAVEDTGLSPQYILEEAALAWLTEHGYYQPPDPA